MTATYSDHTNTRGMTRAQQKAARAADLERNVQANEAHLAQFRRTQAFWLEVDALGLDVAQRHAFDMRLMAGADVDELRAELAHH